MDDLVISVDADVTKALSKIDAFKAKVGQLTENQGQLKAVINDLNTSLRLNEKELTAATVKLQKLNTTTTGGKQAAASLRTEIAQLAANSKTLGDSLNTAKTNLAQTTSQLKNSTTELKKAEKATGGFAGGLTKAYSGLRTLANIIPGLGISGIILVAVDAVKSLVEALGGAGKAQKILNNAMAEAVGSVGGEVAQLRSLVSIAKDTSLSYDARTQAIKELNKEYPGLHGNITLENVGTDKITAAINNEIEAIKRRSKAKALEKLIDEESAKLEQAKQFDAGLNLKEAGAITTDFFGKVSKFLGAPGLIGTQSALHEALVSPIIEGQKKIDLYAKALNDLNKEAAIAGTLFVAPAAKSEKVKKDVETISDVLSKMRAQLVVIGKNEDFFGTNESLKKIQLIESTITELFTKFKLQAENPIVLKLGLEANDIKEREDLRKLMPDLISKDFTIPVPLEVTPPKIIDIKKVFIPISDELLKMTALMQDTFSNLAASIGESLGNAFSGSGSFLKDALGGVFNIMGDFLIQLGKAAVITSKLFLAIKASKINPISGIIGGIAAIAAGIILKNVQLPGFATGGFVSGPGTSKSDSIHARLSKGEYIMSADTVSRFGKGFFDMINGGGRPRNGGFANGGSVSGGNIGGGFTQTIIPDVVVRGSDLLLVFDRASSRRGRNG